MTVAAACALAHARPARCDEGSAAATSTAPATPAPSSPLPAGEENAARPRPLSPIPITLLPWERMLDIGGDFALVARSATHERGDGPSRVRYQPATGFALHIRWPIMKWLQIEGYYLDVHMPVQLPPGSLGVRDTITSPPVETFVFGARVSPRLMLGPVTLSLTVGAGWGRFEFQRMTARTAGGAEYKLRERGASFVEIPIGFGFSWQILKWLTFDLQMTAAPLLEQHGEAFSPSQAVDPTGKLLYVGPLPIADVSLAQTIGLSLSL